MRIKKLTVTNLRGFTHAEFDFQPGMNLLVGVNGVGKTTVLDAVRVCMTRVLPEITASQNRKEKFEAEDVNIMADKKNLQVSCDIEINNLILNVTQLKPETNVVEDQAGNPRAQVMETHDDPIITTKGYKLDPDTKKSNTQPLVIYFSTRRSLFVEHKVSSSAASRGQAAAFSEALSINRESNLRVLAEWYKVQKVLGEERPIAVRHIAVLNEAIKVFMPGFDNLVVNEKVKGEPHFTIDKNGIPLNVRYQLSDGERGMLALVLELAKRLSQANPEMDNPLEGEGVVLIDELDLHLHPKWQRTIVENLERTFPNLQFIATTHSPQVIGEVDAKHITIIDKTIVEKSTYNPAISFGLDSSSVLEEILDSSPRNKSINKSLNELFGLIDEEKLKEAKNKLEELKEILGPNNPDIVRSETMINFFQDDITDETDKKE